MPETITTDAGLPPPGFNRRISYAAALARFTPGEWAAIDLFSMFRLDEPDEIGLARAQVRTFMTNLAACASTYVYLDDQRVHAGLAGLVALGLLGEGRATEIQGPDPAPHELPRYQQ